MLKSPIMIFIFCGDNLYTSVQYRIARKGKDTSLFNLLYHKAYLMRP